MLRRALPFAIWGVLTDNPTQDCAERSEPPERKWDSLRRECTQAGYARFHSAGRTVDRAKRCNSYLVPSAAGAPPATPERSHLAQ